MSDDKKRGEDVLAAIRVAQTFAAFRADQDEPCEDCDDEPTTAAMIREDVAIHGLAAPYDTPTGDGREIAVGALVWDLDVEGVPIIWDRQDGDHTGMVLGRVDAFSADATGLHVDAARLFATDDPEAAAAVARVVELIVENAIGWSLMLDDEEVEATYREPVVTESEDGSVTARFRRDDQVNRVVSGRVRHLALVDTPAFPGARPLLGPVEALAAAAQGAVFPAAHFERWKSRDAVPLQVTADGRVWGHAAGDGCFRTGSRDGMCKKYQVDPDPRMRNFHTGTATLDSGEVIRAGVLTAANLHASVRLGLDEQRQYHENTSLVWAKVVAWNDAYGRLCVTGSVVPGLDEKTLAQVAGTPLSVELWPVPGVSGLTLVGAHTVNAPAWPVAG